MEEGVHEVWLVGTDIYQHQQEQQQQQRNHVDADGLDREKCKEEGEFRIGHEAKNRSGQRRDAGGGSSFRNNGHPVRRLCYFNENWKVLPLLLLLLQLYLLSSPAFSPRCCPLSLPPKPS